MSFFPRLHSCSSVSSVVSGVHVTLVCPKCPVRYLNAVQFPDRIARCYTAAMGFGIISRFVKRERRAYPRQPVHFDVMYGRGEDLTLSTAVDLSEEGLSFLSSRTIPEGSRLRVRLMMELSNQEDCIEVESTVIRNEEKLTVVTFAGLTRSERQKILRYMSQPASV